MTGVSGSVRLPVCAALATATSLVCLGPTFLTGTWFFPSLFGVLLVGAGCELTRRYATSSAVVPLGGLLTLTAYLLLRYASVDAWLHLVPTGASLDRLAALANSGREDIARYAAPIGVSPGIELLTVAGVGLVALAVDTLAVTWRRAALAGLPLLVLYTVPTAIAPGGVSWLAFAVAGTGFLTLLLAESRERVSRWGRPMTDLAPRPNWTPQVETGPLSQVGRRVGATALGLALVVPAVLPDVDTGTFGFGSGGFGSGGGGGNKVAVVNPILDLGENLRRSENRPVINYRGTPTYLRLVGLDEFTGSQWKPSELEVSRDDNNVEDGLGSPPGLSRDVARKDQRYRIRIFDLKNTWLPLPYPAKRVSDIDGTWLYDASTFNVFGENTSTLQLSYGVRALAVNPTAEQLRDAPKAPASLNRYLELPEGMSPRIEVKAREVVDGLPNYYERALALQDWLRSDEFSYSTEVADTVGDGNGSEAILGFLETRTGYCVQFAATMAVMARLLDIPARVAVGFTAGYSDGTGGRTVGLHDAHAWPELYFQGVGWVRFEPTPGVRTGEPPPWARDNGAGPGGSEPSASAAPTAAPPGGGGSADAAERRRQDILGLDPGTGGGGGIGAGPVRIPVVPLLGALGVLLLLAVPAVVRLLVRRRRWSRVEAPAELARAAWADLRDTLTDFGHAWRSSDSPRAGVERLVRERRLPADASDAAYRISGATEQARYAPAMSDVGDLRSDVDLVRAGLRETASRWTRWRARLLPRSTRSVAAALGERFADGLDAVDAAMAAISDRLAGRLRPRRG